MENFEIPLPPIDVQLAAAKKHAAFQIQVEKQKNLIAKMQIDLDLMVDEIFGK